MKPRKELRRRVRKALRAWRRTDWSLERRVHEARRGLKKARATLRLTRAGLAKARFKRIDHALRAAGRVLSPLRDAQALPASLERLDGVPPAARSALKSESAAASRAALEDSALGRRLERCLRRGKRAARGMPKGRLRWRDEARGLRRSYRRGRRLAARCGVCADDASLHDWRKAAKTLRYQLASLSLPESEELKPLTDLLGEAHDLSVLRAQACARPSSVGGRRALSRLDAAISRRQSRLRVEAADFGRLFARRPKAALARWKSSEHFTHPPSPKAP